MPAADTLARLFDSTFAASHAVRMLGGATEPLYLPARAAQPAQLRYTRDYPSSALHEAAHWCLAGAQRRGRVDFGFAYVPTAGRSAEAQRCFERAEARTQAVEWRLSLAAGVVFHLSVDALDCNDHDRAPFLDAVCAEVQQRLRDGWPPRVQQFACALASALGGIARPQWDDFARGLADV